MGSESSHHKSGCTSARCRRTKGSFLSILCPTSGWNHPLSALRFRERQPRRCVPQPSRPALTSRFYRFSDIRSRTSGCTPLDNCPRRVTRLRSSETRNEEPVRIANLDGRATIVTDQGTLDVATASNGAFSASIDKCLSQLDTLQAWFRSAAPKPSTKTTPEELQSSLK